MFSWFLAHKTVTILGILLLAFVISTIVLAVELSYALKDDTEDSNNTEATTTTPTSPRPATGSWENITRIPEEIVPLSYDLLLHPDLQEGSFTGSVTIKVNLTSPRDWISLHIKNLEVTTTELTTTENTNISITRGFEYKTNEFFVIEPSEWLESGEYNIKMTFEGNLTDSIVGFYRSTYTEAGQTKYIATSKFEPVDARQAFPCFDEPALKAKFKVKLVRPASGGYSALSNMNELATHPGPGENDVTVEFAETVPMSTYLACFIVSDFKDSGEALVDNQGKKFPVKVYSTPGQVANTAFARSAAAQVVRYYMDYFGIPYPLPKLDLIAIPDFVSGAMEHWGLITFRETALLFNQNVNSVASQKRVALVVAHEIAHQWFGNLVTMSWWDDLWLNEGFASFMEYKGVANGIAECQAWEIQDQSVYDDIQSVMGKDATLSSHPIVQSVDHPNQINEIFDSISYDKGQAVLRMLEAFMGEGNFKKGIQSYLKAHQYSNAATADLWASLDAAVPGLGINVTDVMSTWTRQMGFPVINVTRTATSWVLSQERFLADPNAKYNASESEFGYTWDIPIHYVTSDDTTERITWLKRDVPSISIPANSGTRYVKLNYRQIGFYRVNYPEADWQTFTDVLRSSPTALHKLDRANLLDDAFSLADAGYLEYSTALNTIAFLKHETDYMPWATAATILRRIADLLTDSPQLPHLKKHIRSLVELLYGNAAGQYNWEVKPSDTHLQRLLRVKILDLACYSGIINCVTAAGAKFAEWIRTPTADIHPDVRFLIYRYGMATVGTEEEWDIVWERYLSETNAQEKVNLLDSLARVQEPLLLKRYLEYAKNETAIRSQDYFSVLSYISSNPIGAPIVWDFYRQQWQYLVNRFTLYHRTLGTSILSVTSSFSTKVKLEEVEAFYQLNPEAGAGQAARKSALERIKNNINWLERNEAIIGDWLAAHPTA